MPEIKNPRPPRNLFSFLAAEHEHELASTLNHATEIDMLQHVDHLFRDPIERFYVPQAQRPLVQLYIFIHYHLYTTFSNLMRMHLAEALGCKRKAIDAAFTAYRMLVDPTSIDKFEARERKFLTIKSFIEKARRQDPSSYPHAVELLKAWDQCSEYGAHADSSTFAHRLEQVPITGDPTQQILYFQFFTVPPTMPERSIYYLEAFITFLTITRIFQPFIAKYAAQIPIDEWAKERDETEQVIRDGLAAQYRLHAAWVAETSFPPAP